jgi:lantibiotic modifying enzyme
LAHVVIRTLRKRLEQSSSPVGRIGVFDGACSLLYLFTHLGVLWDDPSLLQTATQIAELIEPQLEQDDRFDIISGVAGCILALLNLYQVAPTARVLEGAIRCGNHLIQHFALDSACSAPEPEMLRQRGLLTGYSHGAAGMAASLNKLALVSGQMHFLQASEALLAFERTLFSVQRQNWPDLRDRSTFDQLKGQTSDEETYMTAWCHGAAGIALSRMELLHASSTPDPYLKQEIAVACVQVTANNFPRIQPEI